MDLVTLKKKLSTYESDKGYLKNVSDDVLYEVLVAWENWTGPTKDFYRCAEQSSEKGEVEHEVKRKLSIRTQQVITPAR